MPSTEALKLGSSALLSYRAAIETTGHNIANISTPGYSRQRVLFNNAFPNQNEFGAIGRGVEVGSIERLVDDFLDAQLRVSASDTERWTVLDRTFRALEAFFNELGDTSLGDILGRFFSTLNDIAANVEDLPLRTQAVEQARSLRDVFTNMRFRIDELRRRLDLQVPQIARRINQLTSEIASLNERISHAEAGGAGQVNANDLRDTRGQRLRELAGIIGVSVQDDERGGVIVTVGTRPLVYLGRSFDVTAEKVEEGGAGVYKLAFKEDGAELPVEAGTLRGIYDARDETVVNYAGWLDDFAASIIYRVNSVHSTGVGLEPYEVVHGTNTVLDPSGSLGELELEFQPGNGLFEITSGDLVIRVVEQATGAVTSHRIKVAPSMALSGGPSALVESVDALANISAQVDSKNRVVLQADNGYGVYFSEDSAGVLPVLGLAGLFSGYDAGTIDVNPDLDGHPELYAGASSLLAGDNSNAMSLAEIEMTGMFLDTGLTLEEAYQEMVGMLGSDALSASDALQNQNDILLALENERQQISGVSLDEELANLIQFQRAYQGMAKFISVIDRLMETLLEM